MLSLFRLLLLSINLDQKTVLNWFGMEDPTNQKLRQALESGAKPNLQNLENAPNLSFETFRIILEGFWEKIQDGLTLADIENLLFFILFLRFVILAIRYNLKTSFYITCIGLFAGYLWYKHLIDLISMYRSVLMKLPFLQRLGIDAIQLRLLHRQMVLNDLKLGENVHWYNPGQILYYAFKKGMIRIDPETGLRYYIDPISMVISNFNEPLKAKILPGYYTLYQNMIPKIFEIATKFWKQFSGLIAYAVITRLGKRYCPYLIRWHWTFLLILGFLEPIWVFFIYRVYYFQTFVLIPQTKSYINYVDPNLILQINFLNGLISCVVLLHIGFVIFGLFHAICGQYFYFPFLVPNTELHVGPRPVNSIYSTGATAWQDPAEKDKNRNRLFPKLWYGWFGRGTRNKSLIDKNLLKFIQNFFKTFQKKFFK